MNNRYIAKVAAAALAACAVQAWAADPDSGSVSPAAPDLSYTSGPFLVSNPVGITANGAPDCIDPVAPCDDFALTVDVPADYDQTHPGATVRIAVGWSAAADDYDIFLYDAGGAIVAQSAGGSNPEVMTIAAGAGARTYTVRIVPFTVTGSSTETLISLASPTPGTVTPPPVASGIAPRYAYHQSPSGKADGAGEPTIGFNPHTGRAMFIAALETDRVTFAENADAVDAAGNPLPASCDATWEDVSYALAVETLDPILETEQSVGRTFASQLTGANSIFAYSDDDGDTWIPGQIGPPNGGVDHQTIGSGPYSPNFTGLANPDGYAVYYCSQSVAAAFCARSDDGGQTFGPGIPIYEPALDCEGGSVGALHGHVQVADNDGTVYVPFGGCGATQAVSVSEDSGLTWTVKPVPQSEPGDDPGVGIASDGTAYFCYINGTGSPHVTVSGDKGDTWINDADIGAAAGIKHAVFPTAVAGDGDRAACAFIGTPDDGNPEALDFEGVWYPYVAMTYDGGQTWHTVNVSPNDPIQGAGGICLSGTTCGSNRNLLDFNDIIKDDHGRVLFALADGCVGACVQDPSKNSFTDDGVIVRQSGGKTLLAAFDTLEPTAPGGACVAGSRSSTSTLLQWREPDNGGSPITGYDVYRGTSANDVNELIGSTSGKPAFEDDSTSPAVDTYYYRVVAKNANGSRAGNVIALAIEPEPVPETSCSLPGITVTAGEAGNCTLDGCTPQTDLVRASVAELPSLPDQLVFDIKVDSLDPAPLPGNYWFVLTSSSSGESLYLSMDTSTGTPVFSYGTYTAGTAGLLSFSYVGDLNAASTYTTDGHIYLVADKSIFGDLQPGSVISPIDVRTRTGLDLAPSRDTLAVGDYTLQGTAACLSSAAPLALLGADDQFGEAPFTVNFTVSGGVSEPGLSLKSYSLGFGDGESASGDFNGAGSVIVEHTYAANGAYPARLTVTDSNDAASENRAERVIQVGPVPDDNTGGGGSGGGGTGGGTSGDGGGGTAGLGLLLPLLGVAWLRRRRIDREAV